MYNMNSTQGVSRDLTRLNTQFVTFITGLACAKTRYNLFNKVGRTANKLNTG